MYDYRQLVRFGIDRSLLPSGSVVIHEPVSFYKVNKTIIYGVALSTVALVSFTAVLRFNIRRRKKMELHLLKLSSEQQTILDTASSVIWHVVDHTIIWSNEATVRMLGYSADELQGTDYRQLLAHDTDGLYEQVSGIDVVSLKENEYQAEVRLRRKDGKLIWCSATARLIVKASPKDGYICILTDVTERHRVEQLLIEACDAADIANRAKNCFLNNMSHELRTPMNGILGMTSLLQLTDLSDEQRHYLEAVEASTTNLLSLITDILNFSKLNAELVAFESLPFSIKECINEVFEQHAARIRQKGLTAHVVFSPDVPQTVLGDQGRIHQMVHHLLSNAVKFSLQGTIEISLKVMSRSDSKVMLRLQLADTGVGIPAELNNSVFSPFNQADNSSTRRFGGAGLGLSIVSYLVNAMGGYIQLISNKEGGTTALLDIPLHLPENVPN